MRFENESDMCDFWCEQQKRWGWDIELKIEDYVKTLCSQAVLVSCSLLSQLCAFYTIVFPAMRSADADRLYHSSILWGFELQVSL